MISLLDIYNNTYTYFPIENKEPFFFHNDAGMLIRTGLTIYSLPKKIAIKGNKSRFTHLSLQQNIAFRVIKRGMPKLYELNLNPKIKKKEF